MSRGVAPGIDEVAPPHDSGELFHFACLDPVFHESSALGLDFPGSEAESIHRRGRGRTLDNGNLPLPWLELLHKVSLPNGRKSGGRPKSRSYHRRPSPPSLT